MTEFPGRASREIVVSDNPPSSEQLFLLAKQAMLSGRSANTLRRTITPYARFNSKEVQYANDAADLVYDNQPVEIRHRISVRMGRKVLGETPMKKWSMRVTDTHWFERPSGNWDGLRSIYRFEWDRNAATLAERKSYFVPEQSQQMDFYLDNMPTAGSLDLASIQLDVAQVTADDCEQLIYETAEHYEQLGQRYAA